MNSSPYTIRTLANMDEYHTFERLQALVWQSGDLDVVPSVLLLTMHKNGGLVAGAFDPDGTMVGLVTGFIGLKYGRYRHCSHIAGVIPELRRQNVGFLLKAFQRDYVLSQGFNLITWTFDPLESVNANLNINKLGGIARTYSENHYGYWNDGLNAGLPTDRFEVEWVIDSVRVTEMMGNTSRGNPSRITYSDVAAFAQPILATGVDARGVVTPLGYELGLNAEVLLLEIPAEYQQIKALSMELAEEWRLKTRVIFKTYFERGYAVTELVSQRQGDLRRNYYVLRQRVDGVVEQQDAKANK